LPIILRPISGISEHSFLHKKYRFQMKLKSLTERIDRAGWEPILCFIQQLQVCDCGKILQEEFPETPLINTRIWRIHSAGFIDSFGHEL